MRSGRVMVKEWLAPLCSVSGATTQTSGQRARATFARSFSPGALMPSSFEIRMRAAARSRGVSNISADHLKAAHIGSERVRHCDRAVSLLVILEQGDECAADGKARAVESMDEARSLPFAGPEPRLHPPRLELAAIGAARDLAVGPLPRQPYLDVIGLPRGET